MYQIYRGNKMQIELSNKEIETILNALMIELGHLNQAIKKDTSTFRPMFEENQRDCNELYNKLYNKLMDDQE